MYTKFYQNRFGFVEAMTKTFGVFLPVHSVVYNMLCRFCPSVLVNHSSECGMVGGTQLSTRQHAVTLSSPRE